MNYRTVLAIGVCCLAMATWSKPASATGRFVIVRNVNSVKFSNSSRGANYVEPVEAKVFDHFRIPQNTYGPGNRGIDYATQVGQLASASAEGQVVFAGAIGGKLHVVVRHIDGVKTSYSFLEKIFVQTGQVLRQGDPLGTASSVLHFGVRYGGYYLDPSILLNAKQTTNVRLVPTIGIAVEDDRSFLGSLTGTVGSIVRRNAEVLDRTGRELNQIVDRVSSEVHEYVRDAVALTLVVTRELDRLGVELVKATSQRIRAELERQIAARLRVLSYLWSEAQRIPGVRTFTEIAITLARELQNPDKCSNDPLTTARGINELDRETYEPARPNGPRDELVNRGQGRNENSKGERRRTDDKRTKGDQLSTGDQRTKGDNQGATERQIEIDQERVVIVVPGFYSSYEDSYNYNSSAYDIDLGTLGYESENVYRFSYRGGTAEENPFSATDSSAPISNSSRHFAELVARVREENPTAMIDVVAHSQGGLVSTYAMLDDRVANEISTLVTLATPFNGAPLAEVADLADQTPTGRMLKEFVSGQIDVDPNGSINELYPGSEVLKAIRNAEWPESLDITSIAGRGDLTTPPQQARLKGANNVTVGVKSSPLRAHSEIVRAPEAIMEIKRALAGQLPKCRDLATRLTNAFTSAVTKGIEEELAMATMSQLVGQATAGPQGIYTLRRKSDPAPPSIEDWLISLSPIP